MNFILKNHVSEEEVEELHALLHAYNHQKCEKRNEVPFGIFLEDENGKKIAGITGEIFGLWLCIEYLFVSENLRGRGIGTSLLKQAEENGIAHGAKYAFVDTFDFQAPNFYPKYGYNEVFRLTDYPYTGYRCYFTKTLVGGE